MARTASSARRLLFVSALRQRLASRSSLLLSSLTLVRQPRHRSSPWPAFRPSPPPSHSPARCVRSPSPPPSLHLEHRADPPTPPSQALAQNLINTPSLYQCTAAALTYQCAAPPCTIVARPSGDQTKQLWSGGEVADASGSVSWKPVDVVEGTDVTLWITDSNGATVSSAAVVVSGGSDDWCVQLPRSCLCPSRQSREAEHEAVARPQPLFVGLVRLVVDQGLVGRQLRRRRRCRRYVGRRLGCVQGRFGCVFGGHERLGDYLGRSCVSRVGLIFAGLVRGRRRPAPTVFVLIESIDLTLSPSLLAARRPATPIARRARSSSADRPSSPSRSSPFLAFSSSLSLSLSRSQRSRRRTRRRRRRSLRLSALKELWPSVGLAARTSTRFLRCVPLGNSRLPAALLYLQ